MNDLHPAVLARLERLTPDQRAAATAPPGPVLCVAPAGSGKTTTLVARVTWLVASGAPPDRIAAITFNRRAAEELRARLDPALEEIGCPPASVRVRTFHALGLEILRSAGVAVRLASRASVLRRIRPDDPPETRRRLDDAISRLKLDAGVTATDIAADPAPGPLARAFVAYEAALERDAAIDFDDLVVRALRRLRSDHQLLRRWRAACEHLLVDEVQDVDRSQLELAIVLSAPSHRIFLVGDDDQSIYGWRLADVRRVLHLEPRLPGLRRVDLVTNFRCPGPVVERSVRLVERNDERFAKRILARAFAPGRLILAPDGGPDPERWRRVLASWPSTGATSAILCRTNRELIGAVAAALGLGRPFRAPRVVLPLDSPWLDALLEAATELDDRRRSPLMTLAAGARSLEAEASARPGRRLSPIDRPAPRIARPDLAPQRLDGFTEPPSADGLDDAGTIDLPDTLAAVLAWAAPYRAMPRLVDDVVATRERLLALRRDDAPLTLSTAHGTKGLEFDHVAVLMDAERFPSARAIEDAVDPVRALEEERRLAYVAWTRARRTLTLLYDPARPSPFLAEAFGPDELGVAA